MPIVEWVDPEQEHEPVYTVLAAARILGCGSDWLFRLLQRGDYHPIHPHRPYKPYQLTSQDLTRIARLYHDRMAQLAAHAPALYQQRKSQCTCTRYPSPG